MLKVQFSCSLPVSILKEGEVFVAYSPALDLSTYGKSFDEVQKRFNEVVEIFFEELIEKGTVNDVLSGLGWQKEQKSWVPPIIIANETRDFRIPVSC